MKTSARVIFCLGLCAIVLLALAALAEAGKPPPTIPPNTKTVTMSTREDYDKGADLDDIALDFALINTLDIDELICSFGWDDYEPERQQYDWVWLNDFCNRAAQYNIKLRPYICYTPSWAYSGSGSWNTPPDDINDWYNFCYNLGLQTRNHANVVSLEVWNEWNDEFWFDGTFDEYKAMMENASLAWDAAYAPAARCTVVLGGLVWPHYEAIEACTLGTFEQYYEIVPFHCYSETWPEHEQVEGYLDSQYYEWFVPCINNEGEAEPIWVNECGFSTMDRPEIEQAAYFVRAVSYYFKEPEIEHFTAYEIRNLDPNSPVIGDENNYYFGLVYFDRTPKLAFYTYDVLTDLFDDQTITYDNTKVSVTCTSGRLMDDYHYLFQKPDGSQIFVVYDKKAQSATVSATLVEAETTCVRWNFDGTSSAWTNFDGTTISNIHLSKDAADVYLFELTSP